MMNAISIENSTYHFGSYMLPISIIVLHLLSHKLFLQNLPSGTKNFSFFPYANLRVKTTEMQ